MSNAESPRYVLDGTKLAWHADRFRAWLAGRHIAPVTVDWALTTACNFHCQFCAKLGQTKKVAMLPPAVAFQALADMKEMGVRGVVFMSDGESTLVPYFVDAVLLAKRLGLSVACATNGYMVTSEMAEQILPALDYLRFNFSAGMSQRYSEIMGVPPSPFARVAHNIGECVKIKRRDKLPVTLNISMVLQPKDTDQIVPFALAGKALGVDYAIIKHCLDYETGEVAVDWAAYAAAEPLIKEAEAMSTPSYLVTAKWSKIKGGRERPYHHCYGPPFLLQISGTGLVAACGPKFNAHFAEKFHIGNINKTRLIDLWRGERYWEVMSFLRSNGFDAVACPPGCVQHNLNCAIDAHFKGQTEVKRPEGESPEHLNFI